MEAGLWPSLQPENDTFHPILLWNDLLTEIEFCQIYS